MGAAVVQCAGRGGGPCEQPSPRPLRSSAGRGEGGRCSPPCFLTFLTASVFSRFLIFVTLPLFPTWGLNLLFRTETFLSPFSVSPGPPAPYAGLPPPLRPRPAAGSARPHLRCPPQRSPSRRLHLAPPSPAVRQRPPPPTCPPPPAAAAVLGAPPRGGGGGLRVLGLRVPGGSAAGEAGGCALGVPRHGRDEKAGRRR